MNQEDKLVEQLAAPIIEQHKKDKGFLGRRNRSAWLRMNRPEKLDKMEKGSDFIFGILGSLAIK